MESNGALMLRFDQPILIQSNRKTPRWSNGLEDHLQHLNAACQRQWWALGSLRPTLHAGLQLHSLESPMQHVR